MQLSYSRNGGALNYRAAAGPVGPPSRGPGDLVYTRNGGALNYSTGADTDTDTDEGDGDGTPPPQWQPPANIIARTAARWADGKPRTARTQARYSTAKPRAIGYGITYTPAAPKIARTATKWNDAKQQRSRVAIGYSPAAHRLSRTLTGWTQPPLLTPRTFVAYSPAEQRKMQLAATWSSPPLIFNPVQSRWQTHQHTTAAPFTARWSSPPQQFSGQKIAWGHRAPVTTCTIDVPEQLVANLAYSRTGGALNYNRERYPETCTTVDGNTAIYSTGGYYSATRYTAPDIERADEAGPVNPPAPSNIPLRSAYTVILNAEILRTRDNAVLNASQITLDYDAESWSWGFSATLIGPQAANAVRPTSNGHPVELLARVQGHEWRLQVDSWAEQRQFASQGTTVRGRSLSAELAAPAQLPASGVETSTRTLTQLLAQRLPPGWVLELAPGTADWLVPGGAFSWQEKTPIQVIFEAAQAVGYVVIPHRTERRLIVQARYPVLPWQYTSTAPQLVIPAAAIASAEGASSHPGAANAVYVHGGETGGILARVKRAGTAGDQTLATANHPLITEAAAARALGGRLLAAQAQPPEIASITTLLGGDFPLAEVGQLLRITDDETQHHGIVSAVSVVAQFGSRPSVSQTIRLAESTGNQLSQFRKLLPSQPLLAGEITNVNAGGVTVQLISGGVVRVRGTGSVGASVYLQNGQIQGPAPSLQQVNIEV